MTVRRVNLWWSAIRETKTRFFVCPGWHYNLSPVSCLAWLIWSSCCIQPCFLRSRACALALISRPGIQQDKAWPLPHPSPADNAARFLPGQVFLLHLQPREGTHSAPPSLFLQIPEYLILHLPAHLGHSKRLVYSGHTCLGQAFCWVGTKPVCLCVGRVIRLDILNQVSFACLATSVRKLKVSSWVINRTFNRSIFLA